MNNRLKGRYELLEPIGQGGFAITYRAIDHLLNRYVAVKVSIGTLKHEASILRMLEHVPYISHIYDYFTEKGKDYLVLRLISGIPLTKRTKESGTPVTGKELMTGLPSLLTALDQIHRRNVIHRDISPGNLILAPDGTIYLIDFEAATSIEQGILKNTRVYTHKGFDAPEHLKGNKQDVSMDIYSLCATVTYLMTGSGIPEAEERLNYDPVPQILMGSTLSKQQQNALLKGLCLQAEKRYADVMSFARDFYETDLSADYKGTEYHVFYSAQTDIGSKPVNQDTFLLDRILSYSNEDCEIHGEYYFEMQDIHIAAISDGVSNACYGELASKAVIQAVAHFMEQYRDSEDAMENRLEELLDQINEKILSLGKKIGQTAATLAMVLWKDEWCYIAAVGDSAVYRYRKGHVERLTVPHTRAREKMEKGQLFNLSDLHTLTAYLGKKGCSGWQMADYQYGKICKGDKFLICSDGIATELSQEEIARSMAKRGDQAVSVLWKYIKRRKIKDNCTAIVLHFNEAISKEKEF